MKNHKFINYVKRKIMWSKKNLNLTWRQIHSFNSGNFNLAADLTIEDFIHFILKPFKLAAEFNNRWSKKDSSTQKIKLLPNTKPTADLEEVMVGKKESSTPKINLVVQFIRRQNRQYAWNLGNLFWHRRKSHRSRRPMRFSALFGTDKKED